MCKHSKLFIRAMASVSAGLLLILSLAAAAEIAGREQALAALRSPDAAVRLEGVLELGKHGKMADAQALLNALHDQDDSVRAVAEFAVWQVWMRSGDEHVDEMLQIGIRHLEAGEMGRAVDAFTKVIEVRPDFAEGWNKRATTYYLMGDYEQSLKDCDEVIKRNPNHFGALSGYGLIYVQLGDLERALQYFEKALKINPNMEGVQQSIELILYRLGREGKRSI